MSKYFVAIIVLCTVILSDSIDVERTIKNGRIRGEVLKSFKGQDYYSFKGIPFAEPPVGILRFQPPKLAKNWEGILNATSDRKICHQILLKSEELIQDEDCLYVNVYAPKKDTSNKSLPVMVWIYGGGFLFGHSSSSLYGPDYFMDYDVVVVTFNYRLGIFGFLSTEDLVLPGNVGLKDQLFVLKWVNENIKVFGGDPLKVTIFGESSGAVGVSYLLLSKPTKGLYRAAISQSGSALAPHGFERNPKNIAYKAAKIIDPTFSEQNNSQKLLDFLLTVSAQQLLNASTKIVTEDPNRINLFSGDFFTPVIEPVHNEAMITKSMYESIKSGDFIRVPHMMGMTSEEALGFAKDSVTLKKMQTTWDNSIETLVPDGMNIVDPKMKKQVGALIKNIYVGNDSFTNNDGAAIRFTSDTSLTRPLLKQAVMQSQYTKVYFYKFSYDGPLGQNNITVSGADNVTHFEDIYYLWKVGNIDLNVYPKEDIITHERLLTLWTNFAKTMNPTPEKNPILQNITWPLFSLNRGNFLTFLNVAADLQLKSNPRHSFWEWNKLYNQYGIQPFYTY